MSKLLANLCSTSQNNQESTLSWLENGSRGHAHTDRRTNKKHNASSFIIYWTGGSMKTVTTTTTNFVTT